MKYWNFAFKKPKSCREFNFSKIPLFLIVTLFISIFFGCAGTERFGKRDSNADPGYKNETGSIKNILETAEGIASYYADEFHGRTTANGETYNMYELTAAHKNYPFNTLVRVTNLLNGKSIILRINDRMPDYNKRIIDISFQAARELKMLISGIIDVKIEVLKWGDR
jgi:rare lipoprotein A (peptidoglycan hydrolase)